MSGLCGILPAKYDRSRHVAALDSGLGAIRHRGPQGLSCYHDENILIGHALLDTGCNGFALDEDGFAIAFDGRIDNGDMVRTRLRAADGIHDYLLDTLADVRLILAAYRAFGNEVASMLLGDFAIAIWDPVEQHLFLLRDHLGVRPLFYRFVGDELLFGSEIKALIAMRPDVQPVRREEAMIAFANSEYGELIAEPSCTFFEDVYRLMPGHFAIARKGRIEAHCYWTLDPDLPLQREDVGAEFRSLFSQAITRRLRCNTGVGALLSGGLDSSSIISLLATENSRAIADVRTFSLTFSDVEDERSYFRAVVDRFDLQHTTIDCTAASALADADALLAEHDQPPFGPNGNVFRHFLRRVSDNLDGRIVLHGHGGDEVISNGSGLFSELAASGNWVRLWKELNLVRHVTGASGPHFRRLIWRRGIRRQIGKLLRWPSRFLARNEPAGRNLVTTAPNGRERPAAQMLHLRDITSPMFSLALEITDIDAAFAGVELRMPFLDLDLVQFCVTVEASEKWKDARPRSLIRTAMEGILPDKVLLRTDKHDFTNHLRLALLRDDREIVDDAVLKKADRILPYCNLAQIRADWSDLKTTGELDNLSVVRLWRIVMLSRWLENGPLPDDVLLEAAQ